MPVAINGKMKSKRIVVTQEQEGLPSSLIHCKCPSFHICNSACKISVLLPTFFSPPKERLFLSKKKEQSHTVLLFRSAPGCNERRQLCQPGSERDQTLQAACCWMKHVHSWRPCHKHPRECCFLFPMQLQIGCDLWQLNSHFFECKFCKKKITDGV